MYLCIMQQISWWRACESFKCNVADSDNIFECWFRWYCSEYVLWTWYRCQYRNNGEFLTTKQTNKIQKKNIYQKKKNTTTKQKFVQLHTHQTWKLKKKVMITNQKKSKKKFQIRTYPKIISEPNRPLPEIHMYIITLPA